MKWLYKRGAIIILFCVYSYFFSVLALASYQPPDTDKVLLTKEKYDSLIDQLERNKKILAELSSKLNASPKPSIITEHSISAPSVDFQSQQNISVISAGVDDWKIRLEKLNNEYTVLKGKTLELIKTGAADKRKYIELQNDYDKLKNNYSALNDKIGILTSQVSALISNSATIKILNSELQKKLDASIAENQKLTDNLEDYNKLKTDNLELTRKHSELQQKFEQLFSTSQKLLSDYSGLKKQLDSQLPSAPATTAYTPQYEADIELLKKEKNELLQKINFSEKKAAEMAARNIQLISDIANLTKANRELTDKNAAFALLPAPKTIELPPVKSEIDTIYIQLKTENENLKNINLKLLKSFADLKKQTNNRDIEVSEISDRLATAEKLNKEFARNLVELDNKYIEKIKLRDIRIKELEKQSSDKIYAADKKQEEIHNSKIEILTRRIADLTENNKTLENLNLQLREANKHLITDFAAIEKNRRQEKQPIIPQAIEKETVSAPSDVFGRHIQEQLIELARIQNLLHQKNVELEKKNILLETENRNILKTSVIYRDTLSTLNDRLKKSNDNNFLLKAEISELVNKINNLQPQLTAIEKLKEYDSKIDEFSTALTNEIAKNKNLNAAVDTLKKEYALIIKENLELKKKEFSTPPAISAADALMTDEAARLLKENSLLKESIKKLTEKITEAYKDFAIKETSYKEIIALNEKIISENSDLKKIVMQMGAKIFELNNEIELSRKLKPEFERLRKDYLLAENELIKAKKEFEQLKIENIKINEALDNVQLAADFTAVRTVNAELQKQDKYIQLLEERLRYFENQAPPPDELFNLKTAALSEPQIIVKQDEKLLNDYNNALAELKRAYSLINEYRSQIEELTQNNRFIQNELSSLKNQVALLTQNIESSRQQQFSAPPIQDYAYYQPRGYYYERGYEPQRNYYRQPEPFDYRQNQRILAPPSDYYAPPADFNRQSSADNRIQQPQKEEKFFELDDELLNILKQEPNENRQLPQSQVLKSVSPVVISESPSQSVKIMDARNTVQPQISEPLKKEILQEQRNVNVYESDNRIDRKQSTVEPQNPYSEENLKVIIPPSKINIEKKNIEDELFDIDDYSDITTEVKPQPLPQSKVKVKPPLPQQAPHRRPTINRAPEELLDIKPTVNLTESALSKQQNIIAPITNIKLRFLSSMNISEIKDAAELGFFNNNLFRVSSKSNGELKIFDAKGKKIADNSISSINNWVEGISYSHETSEYFFVDWLEKSVKITDSKFQHKTEIKLAKNIEPTGVEITDDNRIFVITRDGRLIEITRAGKIINEIKLSEKVSFRFSAKGIASFNNILVIGSSEYGVNPGILLFLDINTFEPVSVINIYDSAFDLPPRLNKQRLGFSGIAVDKANKMLYFSLRGQPEVYLYRIE